MRRMAWFPFVSGASWGGHPSGDRLLPESHVEQARGQRPAVGHGRGEAMSERLRPGTSPSWPKSPPRRPCTTRRSRSSTPPTPASTTTRLVALIGDRISFVPRYRQRVQRCRAAWRTRSGSTTSTSTSAYHVRRSALPRPGPGPAPRARGPDRVAPARPGPAAVGGLLRRGARAGPGGGALQVPPGPRRRRSRPSTSARCCSTWAPSSASSATTSGGLPADPPRRRWWSRRSATRCSNPRSSSTPCAATPDRRGGLPRPLRTGRARSPTP